MSKLNSAQISDHFFGSVSLKGTADSGAIGEEKEDKVDEDEQDTEKEDNAGDEEEEDGTDPDDIFGGRVGGI